MSDFELDRAFLNHTPIRTEPPKSGHQATNNSGFRPFLLTGGRTESKLGYETLVWATGQTLPSPSPEQSRIVNLADTPIAVAELAVRADLPVGVTRILIDDLTTAGVLATELTGHATSETPETDDISVVERIIAGLRTGG